ncbi:MAG: efflux RND transporter periplasmic adaptor subunit [Xanthomonadaceae bacterium]|jgi:RND family efflux transporter MFP subunit|nr:efflux RND transporter periplasmic adaptor subunit [Xanthomonadaceae bacterium]
MHLTPRLALPLLIVPLLAGCGADALDARAAAGPVERPVRVEAPQPAGKVAQVRATGRLESADELRLAFKVTGVIAEMAVDAGDNVRAGEVLARLDRTETGAAVERAAQALAKAERDLARAEEVFARGLVAKEARDNAATARDIAAADLRAARFNQQFATVVAPAAGRVKARLAEAGEIVAAGQTVLTLAGESKGWLLRAALADREALRLAVGDPAEVRVDALPGRRFEATVARIAGAADAATGTLDVEFNVVDADGLLRSGLIARIAATPADAADTLSVPVSALLRAEGAEGRVLVVADGRAVAREVRLGAIADGRVAVLEGLAATDAVVVAGAAYVDDGEAVRLVQD